MNTRFDDEVEVAWGMFEAVLERALAEIGVRNFSIDVPGETDETGAFPYVQFAGDGHIVRAEVSGNQVPDETHLMGPDQEASLAALGWERPTEEEGPNWWFEVPDDTTGVLLPMVIAACRQVFGIVHPDFLVSDEVWPSDEEMDEASDPEPSEATLEWPVDVVAFPESHEDLVSMVTAALTDMPGATVRRDSDGDFPFGIGTVPFWVRVHPEKPMLRIFSFVVTSVRNIRQARIEVALLNRRQDHLTYVLVDGTISARVDLLAGPFVGQLLRNTLTVVSEQLDEIAADTAVRVSGKLWLDDLEPVGHDTEQESA